MFFNFHAEAPVKSHRKRLTRRNILNSMMLGAASSLMGCATKTERSDSFTENCLSYNRDSNTRETMLRIDMHCHVLNARDSNAPAFVSRRQFDGRSEKLLEYVVNRALLLIDGDYAPARKEANDLLDAIRKAKEVGQSPMDALCEKGLPGENDIFASDDGTFLSRRNVLGDGRALGFVTSRTRNAAMLMAQFPQIDLFLPSAVDFYEGDATQYTDPARKMQFLSALAIATGGRMLPMVSFNPERYYHEVVDRHAFTNLDLVRHAVEKGGAVAVKVHPSSGFDPYDNRAFAYMTMENPTGCSDRISGSDDERALKEMDKGMSELYALCDELDVPILTHSSTSRGARPECMERSEKLYPQIDETGTWSAPQHQWTNSTHHWAQALEREQKDGRTNLRVVLAHFAGGFAKMIPYAEDREPLDHFKSAASGKLTKSAWLERAMAHIRDSPHNDMFIDTSIMTELAYSQSQLETQFYDWQFSERLQGGTLHNEIKNDGGKLARLFSQFMRDHAHLDDRVMYGSDWHMPSIIQVSGRDAFMHLIERAMPKDRDIQRKVMGENAARFFGLHDGQKNRTRIETFLFDAAGLKKEDVVWMQKIDDIARRT